MGFATLVSLDETALSSHALRSATTMVSASRVSVFATQASAARHAPSALVLPLLMARPALAMVIATTPTNANVIHHMKADHALCLSARRTALCTASATRVPATAATATLDAIAVRANAQMLALAMVSVRVASVTAQAMDRQG